jgi:hypothetical protein
MNKITADHLARRACVYILQSTPDQVQHNLESQRRQYALVDRARALGWQDIDVIDDDLLELSAVALNASYARSAMAKSAPSSAKIRPTLLQHVQCRRARSLAEGLPTRWEHDIFAPLKQCSARPGPETIFQEMVERVAPSLRLQPVLIRFV